MSSFLRNALRSLEQAAGPTSPAAGTRLLYPKSDGWYQKDSAGVETKLAAPTGTKTSALTAVTTPAGTLELPVNESGTSKKLTLTQIAAYTDPLKSIAVATQSVSGNSDTYVTASRIVVPQTRMQAGVVYRCRMIFTKTAAGVGTPAYNVRFGTAGTTADASIGAHTQTSAQTGVIDTAWITVEATFRSVGSGTSAIVYSSVNLEHDLATTGFASRSNSVTGVASSGFNSTTASGIGVSINPGASAAWTLQECVAELLNVAD